jgi:GNAT superfamily N-acetyltransferase
MEAREQAAFEIRPAGPGDVPALLAMIKELAAYERLADRVVGDEARLRESLFERRAAEALIAERDGDAAGYAIFFTSFSTFLCWPGLWLEDVFVRPACRGEGIGQALLAEVAAVAAERGYERLDWSVLAWNEAAIGFYERIGAERLDDWRTMRLAGSRLRELALRR